METPTKQNTLYLTIKQVYFDQIMAGTKKGGYQVPQPCRWLSQRERYGHCRSNRHHAYDC